MNPVEKAQMSDLDIVNAKAGTKYKLATPLTYGVTDVDRALVSEAQRQAFEAVVEFLRDYQRQPAPYTVNHLNQMVMARWPKEDADARR